MREHKIRKRREVEAEMYRASLGGNGNCLILAVMVVAQICRIQDIGISTLFESMFDYFIAGGGWYQVHSPQASVDISEQQWNSQDSALSLYLVVNRD